MKPTYIIAIFVVVYFLSSSLRHALMGSCAAGLLLHFIDKKPITNAFEGQMCDDNAFPHRLQACDGVEDPISFENIPDGEGYCMNGRCYSGQTIRNIDPNIPGTDQRDPFTRTDYTAAHKEGFEAIFVKRKNLEQSIHRFLVHFIKRSITIGYLMVTETLLTQQPALGRHREKMIEFVRAMDQLLIELARKIERLAEPGQTQLVKAYINISMHNFGWVNGYFQTTFDRDLASARILGISDQTLKNEFIPGVKDFLSYYLQSLLRMEDAMFWRTLKDHAPDSALRMPFHKTEQNIYVFSRDIKIERTLDFSKNSQMY